MEGEDGLVWGGLERTVEAGAQPGAHPLSRSTSPPHGTSHPPKPPHSLLTRDPSTRPTAADALSHPWIAAAGVVLYGAGGGIRSLARGTLPLARFGREGYATLMGRIAMPSQVAQALSPTLGALVLQQVGATGSILVLVLLAVVSLVPVLMLLPFARPEAKAA